eukprot:jgi/Astpho2/7725/Aster-02598
MLTPASADRKGPCWEMWKLEEEYKGEVFHELIAEWKAGKLTWASLSAKVPISVIARAEMEQDGQEPDMVTLKAFDRILTALSQAKQ